MGWRVYTYVLHSGLVGMRVGIIKKNAKLVLREINGAESVYMCVTLWAGGHA